VTGVTGARFDGRGHGFIHRPRGHRRRRHVPRRGGLGGALGLALRATLGIPRLSVGTVTVCVGTDRLARALAARRQRLTIRAETGLARLLRLLRHALAGRAELLRAIGARPTRTTAATRTTRAEATRATVIATRAIAARATRTTRTAGATTTVITARTIAARTAGATPATWTTTRTTTAATTEIARRRRQLPADTGARHLPAAGTIVAVGLRLGLRVAELEAAEATRLRRTAVAAESTAAATATTTAAITAAATTAIATAAITCAIVAPALRAGDAIDDVMELAARDRAVRALLALEHADPANLIDTIADDVERLDQTLRAIRLNADRFGDRLHDGVILGRRRRGGAFGLHRLGLALGRFGGDFGGRFRGAFVGVARVRATFDGGRVVLGRRRRCFATIAERRLADRRRGGYRCR
jgi:hypothetical protein